MSKRRFHIATEQEIRDGLVTDVYFERTRRAIQARKADKVVVGEMRARALPAGWPWAVLVGVEEVAHLLEGHRIRVWAPPEGTVFRAGDPVLTIEGLYTEFGCLETAFLGLMCQASGVATRAARCRIAAGARTLLSFGARRMHPALAPMIERAAYVGGFDGVSAVLSARLLGIPPTGTMPHALALVLGDTLEAALAFDEVAEPEVRRIVLIDTFADEKFETLRIAEAMGDKLFGVRFDTPSSRRGNLRELMEETRWELDLRGHHQVKLFASGGLDEDTIQELNPVCDGYGVGTALSNAPSVDFSFDIVEIEGVPMAKRGKKSGGKFIARCPSCAETVVLYWKGGPGRCPCGAERVFLNLPLIDDGQIVGQLPAATDIRAYVLEQLDGLAL
ncbi:MAG TPA: nicotinate phosphoribosyltransferase [Anaerolineae bacterium]|nr:nicotinate phosphoribosyltransferase [Anaerolineae bacterium]